MFNINNKNLISFALGLLAVFSFTFVALPKNALADDCFGNTGWYQSNCSNYQNTYYNNSGNISGNTTNPVPSINSLSPNSGRINTNTIITVTGYGFVPGSVVRWNSEDRPTTYIDAGTLRAQLYSSDFNTSGNYLITVSNPIPGGGLSNATLFTVNNNTAASTSGNVSNNSKSSSSSVTKTNTTNTTTSKNTSTDTSTQPNLNQVKDLAAGAIFGSNAFLPSSIFQWILFFILILLAIVLWRKLYISEEEQHKPLKHA